MTSKLLETYAKYLPYRQAGLPAGRAGPLTIVKGSGSYVWDSTGKKYLDFYGGHAVALLGHSPKSVVSAIAQQAKKLMFYSNIVTTTPAEELATLLASTLDHPYLVYFANSGSEANETALKMARKYTGKNHVISFHGSFHGRGISPLAVTGLEDYHQFKPNLDSHTSFAELGDMKSVEAAYTQETAAVICEPIQSIGGVRMATPAFYQALQKFCAKKKIVLIFDEVQTGLGRTGSFWFSESVGVQPDIITAAKGIASGLPLSVVLMKQSIAQTIKIGEHATTFGGGPVVCVAGIATMKILLKNNLHVAQKEAYIRSKLEGHPAIQAVLGKGLLLGIKLQSADADLPKQALQKGLIIGNSHDKKVFRIFPPLTVSFQEIDQFVKQFLTLLP